jgi:hypothetical protein
MGSFLVLHNRELLPEQGGGRVVYAWPGDASEAYCISGDTFNAPADRVIVAGTHRCSLHAIAEYPCVYAWRTPPECEHERIDLTADPARPRCLTCGLVGDDVSARFLTTLNPVTGTPPPSDAIMLGEPGTPEVS